MSLPKENVEAFRKALNSRCRLSEADFAETVNIDAVLPIDELAEALVEDLKLLEPFGAENPKPVFAQQHVKLSWAKIIGIKKNVLKMSAISMLSKQLPKEGADPISAICFHDAEEMLERFTRNPIAAITYHPGINEYMGQRTLQIEVGHIK